MILIATAAIVAGSIRTVTYAAQWNDRLHFYESASQQQPRSVRLHMLVAVESLSRGKLDEAKEADRLGRESLPNYEQVWIQSAQVAMVRGEFADAQRDLEEAGNIKPGSTGGWMQKLHEMEQAAQAKPH